MNSLFDPVPFAPASPSAHSISTAFGFIRVPTEMLLITEPLMRRRYFACHPTLLEQLGGR
jgi:hypothetical protein